MTNSSRQSKHEIGCCTRVGYYIVSYFSIIKIFSAYCRKKVINQSRALKPTSLHAGLHTRAERALLPWARVTGGLLRQLSLPGPRGRGGGSGGALTVRTRWGSPSAAHGRQLRRCSTGGSGGPPAGSSCRHNTGGSCKLCTLPHPLVRPNRAPGQQSPGLHRHSYLGSASPVKPLGGVREFGETSYISGPFLENLLRFLL